MTSSHPPSRAAGRPTAPPWLGPLQALVANPLPAVAAAGLAGLVGAHPSSYARSPRMWARAFAVLGIDAVYLPLDVPAGGLAAVLALLRRTDSALGVNVTVPYKEAVVPLLDALEPEAASIGAVNTVTRARGGRLVGANTDGAGLLDALQRPGDGLPLVPRLEDLVVLLIGAGGAARAAAFALAPHLAEGQLLITNRHLARAQALAAAVRASGGRAEAVGDDALDDVLPGVRLVINASVRGQAGIVARDDGWTLLEPYSALAPASPPVLPAQDAAAFAAAFAAQAAADLAANHARSRARMRLLPPDAVVYDMIYAPRETTTMRHAREAGLRTAGGRWMNIAQAVCACLDHLCRDALAARGIDPAAVRPVVTRAMAEAWGE
ncbi:MAG: hypothetical protein QN183_07960 [Armatimonadota bacterium]|nr:hypothetical protein [Armatimonadota bacterium]MDR7533470.1 hypothetical protein [Armatimonadota bacterium]MDR7536283.1 hypothetical protein [Armatimonadota bacterium]